MKVKSLLLLFLIMVMALFISPVVARASEPMSEEEIRYYQNYQGKWGGGVWPSNNPKLKGRSVEFQIGKIDTANRKAKVIYSLGEGSGKTASGTGTYMADCVDRKLIFETSTNKIELTLKGNDELFAERSGRNPAQIILKRTK